MPIIDNTLAAQMPQFNAATPLAEAAKIKGAQIEQQQQQFKLAQAELGSEARGLQPYVNSPEFPAKWAETADRLFQKGILNEQSHQQWRNSPSPLALKSIIAQTEDPTLSFRKQEAVREQGNTDRQFGQTQSYQNAQLGIQRRAADRADDPTPDGFEKAPDGTFRPLKGGPQDPEYLAEVARRKGDQPTVIGPGSSVIVPNKVGTEGPVYTNKPAGGLTGTALDIRARQVANGDYSGLANLGRGAQAGKTLEDISNRAAEILVDEGGMSPAEAAAHMSTKVQEYKASGIYQNSEARTAANREANLNLILKATDAAIPAALEASEAVARTGWVPVNKIIQKGEVMASDPNLRKFGMANLQLAEHWARAMNPTGVMRESDRDMALNFLSTADSKETYKQVVGQLKLQITRERDAVGSSKPGAKAAPAAAKPSAADRFQQLIGGGATKQDAYSTMAKEGY